MVMYVILAIVSYSESFKVSTLYFPVGLLVAIIANICWLNIARLESDASKLVMTGLYWDIMLTFVYLAVPFVIFAAKVTIWQSVGIAAIVIGIILTKVG